MGHRCSCQPNVRSGRLRDPARLCRSPCRRRVPTNAMTRELRQETKIQLAFAIAQGRSVALWARDSHVPRSTAYRWASQPDVRAAAESRRRRARKGALGRIASRAYWASYEVATLAECAESKSVTLRALRLIVSGAIATSQFAVVKRRMSAIKQELQRRTQTAGPSCPAVPCSLVDTCRENPKRRHFVSFFLKRKTPLRVARALRISFRRCDIRYEQSFLGESKASWRTCSGGRPTIPAAVHCLPVSPLCAARTRPLRSLTNPRGVPCPK
jgi:hypothetical protein